MLQNVVLHTHHVCPLPGHDNSITYFAASAGSLLRVGNLSLQLLYGQGLGFYSSECVEADNLM